MKRFISIVQIFIICCTMSLIFGCGGRKSISAGSALDVRQTITFKGYPMNATNQTISWLGTEGYLPNQVFTDADQSPFHKWLQVMLGVKIDWQFPVRGILESVRNADTLRTVKTDLQSPVQGVSSAQTLSQALESGNLPDVIYSTTMTDAERYIEEGKFRDLTPYLEKWSPAYWKWLKTNPAYDRAMKTDSGKYYGYGFFREGGGWNDTYLGPVINKAWLDECGLPMPKTVSDWDRTLRVFKRKYGAVLSFAWSRVSGYGTGISGAWGAYSFADFRLYIDKNQKVQLANIQPEYRNQLEKFAEWWKDGLIDRNFFSITDTMARSNAVNKKMGISITSMGQLSNWIQDAKNQKTGAQWVGLQYPRGDDGVLVQVPGGHGIGNTAAVITTSCPDEKLELVMRALDYAYTDEGNLFWNYGKKGISWDYDSEGKPVYLPLVTNDPDGLNNAIDKYGGSTWSGNCIQATALLYMKNSREAIEANNLWFYPNEAITSIDKLPRGMTLTADESLRASELRAIILNYVNESAIRFITGHANFNTWDAYVSRINSMGVAELLGIYQAAYNRYLSR